MASNVSSSSNTVVSSHQPPIPAGERKEGFLTHFDSLPQQDRQAFVDFTSQVIQIYQNTFDTLEKNMKEGEERAQKLRQEAEETQRQLQEVRRKGQEEEEKRAEERAKREKLAAEKKQIKQASVSKEQPIERQGLFGWRTTLSYVATRISEIKNKVMGYPSEPTAPSQQAQRGDAVPSSSSPSDSLTPYKYTTAVVGTAVLFFLYTNLQGGAPQPFEWWRHRS